VVILTNAEEGFAFDSILFHVLDSYFGGGKTDWITVLHDADESTRKEAEEEVKKQAGARAKDSKPSLALQKYAGNMRTVVWASDYPIGKWQADFSLDHTAAAVGDLEHWQYDTFKARWRDRTVEDAYVSFSLNAKGEIEHFTMSAVCRWRTLVLITGFVFSSGEKCGGQALRKDNFETQRTQTCAEM